MGRRRPGQRSIFDMGLPDGEKRWDATRRRIDEVLEDEERVEHVEEALRKRRPKSRLLGRPGTLAEVVLRRLVLKHLYTWSFEEGEREVGRSLIDRAFSRIDCERVPDAKTLIRLAQAWGPEVLKRIVERLVSLAPRRQGVRGLRRRVDTTVVETNIHNPTDSSRLAEGVRVITRTRQKIRHVAGGAKLRFRDRRRSREGRVWAIVPQSRKWRERAQPEVKRLYGQLRGITRAVLRQEERGGHQVGRCCRNLPPAARQRVKGLCQQVEQMSALTQRVLAQTRGLKGDPHDPDKVLSVLEPQTEAIRKGKEVQPTEFGKRVKVQEAESQFITDYQVCARRVPDGELWVSALARHQQLFGRPPRLAAADGALASAANERAAMACGVRRVALPIHGRLWAARRALQQQPWFRRARRWRTGCEGRISALKRRHGLSRCRYRGY